MKHILTIPIFLFTLFSCSSSSDKNSVNLFNNTKFLLLANESIIETEHNLTTEYLPYFENQNTQIPLFKTIKSADYIIYIGIPYRTNIKKLLHFKLSGVTNNPIQITSDSTTFCYKKYKHDQKNIIEFVKKENKNLVYMLAITKSDTLVDSLFSKEQLFSRIKTINND